MCEEIAHKLATKDIGEVETLKILHKIWGLAWEEGYHQKGVDIGLIRDVRLGSLDSAWKAVLDEIDDITHKGFRNNEK